jgi:CRP/FNR family transcriptional regulator, cyclic AMP receptor protein
MVSTELLRRYPFFANLTDVELRALAMISDEQEVPEGAFLFEDGESADFLYLLRTGDIELHHVVSDERGMEKTQDFLVGMINPGEVFGISAVIDPYVYTASGIAAEPSVVIKIEGEALRSLCESDVAMKALVQERIASTTYKRLQDCRVQLL